MLKLKNTAEIVVVVLILIWSAMLTIPLYSVERVAAEPLPSDMPVVHVDPQNIIGDPGDTFTIYVKIFNLSNNFHVTDEQWEYGEPLGPPGVRHNYSLGGLFGLDLKLQWDPTVLEYVEHTVTMPVETYPEGLLHAEPELVDVKDEVDAEAGTYLLSKSSQHPADAFNRPDNNSTAFSMTFTVLKRGVSEISIANADLAIARSYPEYADANADIPHWRVSGFFQTPALATRIDKVEVGAPVGDQIKDPVITGEDAEIRVLVINDNFTMPDTHNITIYQDTTVLNSWNDVTLQPTENTSYSISIDKDDLSVGSETITVELTSTLLASGGTSETAEKTLRVIDVPNLSIQGPSSVAAGETVSYKSEGSTHTDPNGDLLNLTWRLWGPGDVAPRSEDTGSEATFETEDGWLGNFTVTLDVKDNYGVTFDPARPATEPWRAKKTLEIGEPTGPGLFTLDNIVLVVILVVIIALAVVYLRRRSR
ncbi:MAG: hypothetical protein JSV35_06690 [Candidatus Bathyarchaeota archaeon]|nr:MAG: hypothetical protein JSV35_06690 [Candidatus Bathyarchaeota archaeon]